MSSSYPDKLHMQRSGVQKYGAYFMALGFAIGTASAQDASPKRVLRVCADPNNMPFSNKRQEGFENRLAELVATEMKAQLEYTWMPQRRGFIRRTLIANKCDVVMGLPDGIEGVMASNPYYRSTYVFVQRKNTVKALASFDDPALHDMKIGLHAIGDDGANPPPVYALARRGVVQKVRGFKMWDTDNVDSPAGRIIDAVADGTIDLAIVWGPFSYFATRQPVDLSVTPVTQPEDMKIFPFSYAVSMGVREGDHHRKNELDSIVKRRRDDILRILQTYQVPMADQDQLQAKWTINSFADSEHSTGE